ncbi:heterokaryon incompatibility protein-domain-containing protein [Xylaria sp. FL1777]|nr:heterokaryon incompatibility protein-domain-containing protein [Xylaria sp. FL1777]
MDDQSLEIFSIDSPALRPSFRSRPSIDPDKSANIRPNSGICESCAERIAACKKEDEGKRKGRYSRLYGKEKLWREGATSIHEEQLKNFRLSKCELCNVIYLATSQIIRSFPSETTGKPLFLRWLLHHLAGRPTLEIDELNVAVHRDAYHPARLKVRILSPRKLWFDTHLWCPPSIPCPWGYFPTNTGISDCPWEGNNLSCVLKWIEDCSQNHSCGSLDEYELPTRIIDLGRDDNDVKLAVNCGHRSRYVALSHCWGGHLPLTTTTETLDDRKKNIPWAKIPQLYRDAITVTRSLGIRYLWIDSLCILQDSAEDWSHESSRMWSVFGNCWLTIAATHARDSSVGLFKVLQSPKASVKGVTSSGQPYWVCIRETPQHPSNDNLGECFPLLQRAWVFQERILSARVLHFGPGELSWECKSAICCQCRNPTKDQSLARRVAKETLFDGLIGWHRVVEEYTRLMLTVKSDKLPALSGIAQDIRKHRQEARYLAGLWSDFLYVDLLWIPAVTVRAPVPVYRAPSWSWASIDEPVLFPNSFEIGGLSPKYDGSCKPIAVFFDTVQASCVPEAHDETGRIRQGHLLLRGELVKAHQDIAHGHTSSITLLGGKTAISVSNIKSHNKYVTALIRKGFCFIGPDRGTSINPAADLFAVRLTRLALKYSIGFGDVLVDFGLLLERIDPANNIFQRIGLLLDSRKVKGHLDFDDPCESFEDDVSGFEGHGSAQDFTIV